VIRSALALIFAITVAGCGDSFDADLKAVKEAPFLSTGESSGGSSGEDPNPDAGTAGTAATSATSDDGGTTGGTVMTTDTGASTTTGAGTSSGTTTMATTMASTEEATTDAVAVCGNGVVEDSGPLPEECDDGNLVPDDGCGDTCATDLIMFVSSVWYLPGELMSLHLADAICFNRADDAGFLDALRFRAWLSDSTTDARDRLKPGRGRLVLTNGLVVADSWQALLAGELQNAVEVTEKMETYHGGVWTGTRPDGTAVPGSGHCDDWASTSIHKTGYYGYSDRATPEWTLSALDDNPLMCIGKQPIYCLAER